MTNGSNPYGISFADISWLDRLLNGHANVLAATRHDDILWDIERQHGVAIQVICLNEYACGVARVLEVLEVFPDVNLIYVGGVWNCYTTEAKDYCIANHVGVFNTREMAGALHKDEFWTYARRDKEGNPVYC